MLSERFDIDFCSIEELDSFRSKERVVGLFVRLKSKIDDDVLKYFSNLRFLISPTTGLNHLDLEAINRRKVKVISLKGETAFLKSIAATAELTWGLILSLTRKIPQALNHVSMGHWDRDSYRGIDLAGRTLGIVGYGRLGQIIESYAQAFRMKVLINDIAPCEPLIGKNVPLKQLLSESDIITVHVDVNSGSMNMFGESEFRCMKSTAFFINTSRGELVDEDSLIRALREGSLAAAALDVIRDEQSGWTASPLYQVQSEFRERLLVTPHIGGASSDSMAQTEIFIVSKVLNEEIDAVFD